MPEAVAGETGKPFVFVEPGAFIQMFFGIGVLKVRRLFKKLRKLALKYGGVIVFFDEADTLGNRGGAVAGGAAGWNTTGVGLDRRGRDPRGVGPGPGGGAGRPPLHGHALGAARPPPARAATSARSGP